MRPTMLKDASNVLFWDITTAVDEFVLLCTQWFKSPIRQGLGTLRSEMISAAAQCSCFYLKHDSVPFLREASRLIPLTSGVPDPVLDSKSKIIEKNEIWQNTVLLTA
jgi:hypothetical protein